MGILNRFLNRKDTPRAKIISAYKDVFNSPQGKIVLLDLMNIGHVDISTFSSDPYEMARREGERRFALHILEALDIKPSEMLQQVVNGVIE